MMHNHAPLTPAGDFQPSDPAFSQALKEFGAKLMDWHWRITSGDLYQIKAKTKDEQESGEDLGGMAIPFRPNISQVKLLGSLHNRNIVLKARQMGFSTLIEVLALDHALWNPEQNVVVIAHDLASAEELFRDKVLYAYERLPEPIRNIMPLQKRTESGLIFGHNQSSIRVVTSARSGTVHFLHVSEMGKMAAKFPEKARELTTGSLQAVPLDGIAFIESTSEGQSGAFYELATRAERLRVQGKWLTPQDWCFHFFPWWQDPGYRLSEENAAAVIVTLKDHEYFDGIEVTEDCQIDPLQRAWYVAKRDTDFSHEPTLMWREYPSTPEECWKSSLEGKILARQVLAARKGGRVGAFPHQPHLGCNLFWDIGDSDDIAIWVHQHVNGWDQWVGFMQESGGYLQFLQFIEQNGFLPATCYLPHDAEHKITVNHGQKTERTTSTLAQLREARPTWAWKVVPRVGNIWHGIDQLRTDFVNYRFDETGPGIKEGLDHLENYQKQWNTRLGAWANDPQHDEHSHPADAIRQKAQGFVVEREGAPFTRRGARRSGMTV